MQACRKLTIGDFQMFTLVPKECVFTWEEILEQEL
jgi:hypothetical protein